MSEREDQFICTMIFGSKLLAVNILCDDIIATQTVYKNLYLLKILLGGYNATLS